MIPYEQEHVEEYNKWLQCSQIQELTETDPCSLEEEYSYQKEWEQDNQQTSNKPRINGSFILIRNYKIDQIKRKL